MLSGFPTKDAFALCTFGYCAGPGQEPILFEGKTDGKIVSPRGPKNFGWVGSLSGATLSTIDSDEIARQDPIFEVDGTGQT